ncbi:MAG: glutamine amidotransferase [Lentisphaeria bacterium]|jgi:glutamine amidotransferase
MTCKRIAVIDYGMGNLHSVASALAHVAPDVQIDITSDRGVIAEADHIVFPGVGAIRDCIAEIKRLGHDLAVADALASGKPVLGICVGMQALMESSEENSGVACLGMVPGKVKFFSGNSEFCKSRDEGSASGERLKVPHMGWNRVRQTSSHPLWAGIEDNSRFYFVHSYYVQLPASSTLAAGETHFGINFTSAIARDNLFAVQFHPEKSHDSGLQLLKNFVAWDGKVA